MIDRAYVNAWLAEEEVYQAGKWTDGHDEDLTLEDWETIINGYIHRAGVLGLDTPVGRQALGKSVATANAMLATVVRKFGPLPQPGVPSGEAAKDFKP